MINLLCLSGLMAYIGPGAGLSMIGALLAVVGVLLLALLAPLLYVVQWLWSLARKRILSRSAKDPS